jgi:hypothetical protein
VNLRSIVAQERSECNSNQRKARLDVVARVWGPYNFRVWEVGKAKCWWQELAEQSTFSTKFPTRNPLPDLWIIAMRWRYFSFKLHPWDPPKKYIDFVHVVTLVRLNRGFTYSPHSRMMRHGIFKLQVANSSNSLRPHSSLLSSQQHRKARCHLSPEARKLRECFPIPATPIRGDRKFSNWFPKSSPCC